MNDVRRFIRASGLKLVEPTRANILERKVKQLEFPIGTIVAYHKKDGVIPDGWAICNGQPGTPDLKDRFLMGVGQLTEVGQEGGKNKKTVTISEVTLELEIKGGGKSMRSEGYPGIVNHPDGATDRNINSYTHPTDLESDPFDNRPDYFTVVFIIKVR